jgi:hypothetical protein
LTADACARIILSMKTTVDLREDHRARLLELAARRREKGFSGVLAEAVELYLASVERDEAARRAAVELRGTLTDSEAEELRQVSRRLGEPWR